MNPSLLLWCLVLWSACWVIVTTHMLMEDLSGSNQSSSTQLMMQNQTHLPPVIIVGLSNTSKKTKKLENKSKKNKLSGRNKRPPPPPNCVPLWGSCRTPSAVCCESCAFCACRLFKTVCYCRMGYPRCSAFSEEQ